MSNKLLIFIIIFVSVFLLLNFWAVEWFQIKEYPIRKADTFDAPIRTDYREEITLEKPDVIILGDSAIRQLDEEVFSSETGKKTMIFSMPGTGSAYWYLFIRNQVYLSDHRSETFILFFRDSTLTTPAYRVSGEYLVRLEEIAANWDEDVYELAINSRKSPILRALEKYIPVIAYRSEIYFNLVQWFRNFLPEKLLNFDKNAVDQAYEAVFEREQVNNLMWEDLLQNSDAALYLPGSLKFIERVGESFLPATLRDLEYMGIQPIFVRVRYRSHAQGETDQDDLEAYLQHLEEFVTNAGGAYKDLSPVEALSAEMYEDNFHLHTEYGKWATKIIADELIEFLD